VTVAYLASEEPAVMAGRLMVALGVPAIGLACLIIGFWQRSRRPRQYFPQLPQYRPGYPYPPAPPPPIGYPGPYPAPPPYPGYPPAVPPRRTAGKSATTLITVGAVLLVLGGLNILSQAGRALSEHRGGGEGLLRVGDCITESDYAAHHFDARPSGGCSDPAATYELAYKGGASDSCPDGKREHSIYERASNHSTTLCFIINLQQGRCYLFISDGTAVSLKPGDCGDPSRVQVKVAQRIDGSADTTQCPVDDRGIGYPVPARVYCLVKADS
jgi:hypothetical protein